MLASVPNLKKRLGCRKREMMLVRKVKGGFKWGKRGKTYKTKAKAQRQARAAYANGYRGRGKR
jgi:hypothetical protein